MLFFAANTKTTEQHDHRLHKKNCDKDATGAESGSRQKVGQKPEEKWKVVGKDTKRDYGAALARNSVVEPEVSSQTKSRKKRNRRNRDRTASAATLDFRSTSCSTVREDSDNCPKNRISETKSFHTSDKVTCKEKPSSGVNKQQSHAKPDRLPDTFSCRSAGDDGIDGTTMQVVKGELKPASVASLFPGNYIQSALTRF